MTLVVRDEIDIIEHGSLSPRARRRPIVVTDHRSVDGTADVLARYAARRARRT